MIKAVFHNLSIVITAILLCSTSILLADEYNKNESDSALISKYLLKAYDFENSTLNVKLDSTNYYLNLSSTLATDTNNILWLASSADKIGTKFRNSGNYISALKFHNGAFDIASRINDKELIDTKTTTYIASFVTSLKSFSKRYNLKDLELYCMELENNINNFEIEKVDSLLVIFNAGYQKIFNKSKQKNGKNIDC